MHPLDPRLYSWVDNSTIFKWRQYLKMELLKERNWRSDWSGELLRQCEMHEGILKRSAVNKSVKWHYFLYHPYNSILLLPEEHRPNPPNQKWCIEKSFERYGKDRVVEWFASLPFKSIPFDISDY